MDAFTKVGTYLRRLFTNHMCFFQTSDAYTGTGTYMISNSTIDKALISFLLNTLPYYCYLYKEVDIFNLLLHVGTVKERCINTYLSNYKSNVHKNLHHHKKRIDILSSFFATK